MTKIVVLLMSFVLNSFSIYVPSYDVFRGKIKGSHNIAHSLINEVYIPSTLCAVLEEMQGESEVRHREESTKYQ